MLQVCPRSPAITGFNRYATTCVSRQARVVTAAGPEHQEPALQAFSRLIAERRFTCTQCGKCCTGDGEVWIADEEADRMAAYLGMPLQRFYKQYTQAYSKVLGFRLLKSKNNATRDCIFLQPDNTCSIHKARPLQCSTYPWWPDLMNDEAWAWEKANICEGFDHPDAPPTDTHDAAVQLQAATAMEYKRMLSRKPSKQQHKSAAASAASASTTAGQPTLQGLPPLPSSHSSSHSSSPSSSVISGHSSHRQHIHSSHKASDPQQSSSTASSCSSNSSLDAAHSSSSLAGLQPAHAGPSAQQPGSWHQQQQQSAHSQHLDGEQQHAANTAAQQAGGPAAAASKKQAAQEKWQQRLSRLQQLSHIDEDAHQS